MPVQARGTCDIADRPPSPAEAAMFAAINAYRESKGMAPLEQSTTLRRAALWKSQDMANGGPYGHTDTDGRSVFDRIADCGYEYVGAGTGENLANISDGAGVEREVTLLLESWKSSPVHETVQTDPTYKVFGIGRVVGGGSVWWTVVFGTLKDGEGQRGVRLGDTQLPSLEADPCLPNAGEAECGPDHLALWTGNPDAWAAHLRANNIAVTRENIILQTLFYRADRGSAIARALLIQLGIQP